MEIDELWQQAQQKAHQGIVLGLDCMRELMNILGNPQNKIKSIHIAGTNGKGSVLAMISSVLKEAGYRTGSYSSPALFDRREQYQIDAQWITKEDMIHSLQQVLMAGEQVFNKFGRFPTMFELETALAFVYFFEQRCDIMVIECGMGGDEDATNVMTNKVCSVLTAISLDHTAFLGNTLEEIANHKAGIIRKQIPVVLYEQNKSVMECVERHCNELQAPLLIAKVGESHVKKAQDEKNGLIVEYRGLSIVLPFLGIYQAYNVAVVVEIWKVLQSQGFLVEKAAFLQGVKATRWSGRMELLASNPILLADGAHNPAGAMELRKSLQFHYPDKKVIYIIGIFRDKNYEQILKILLPLAEYVITVQSKNPRAIPTEELRDIIIQLDMDVAVMGAKSVTSALELAKEKAGVDGIVCACGSLSFMGELYAAGRRERWT